MTPETKAQFADFLCEEARHLLLDHLAKVEQAAAESDQDGDKPVKAKVGLTFTWEAGSISPKVFTKIGYTVSHKDEVENTFDPMQIKLGLEGEV
jgi:hypothetical protein